MKTLLCVALAAIMTTGCSSTTPIETTEYKSAPREVITPPVGTFGVDLKDYPNARTDFNLENDSEYYFVETYGSVAFKALDVCYSKFDYMIAKLDLSSDYGATGLQEYQVNVGKCVRETLSVYPIIPESDRVKLPRNEAPPVESYEEEAPVAQYDKSSLRYKQLRFQCEANNVEVAPSEFEEAVEFCVSKGM